MHRLYLVCFHIKRMHNSKNTGCYRSYNISYLPVDVKPKLHIT